MGVINRCRRKNFKKEKKKSSQIFESANSSRSRSQRRSNGGRRCEIKTEPECHRVETAPRSNERRKKNAVRRHFGSCRGNQYVTHEIYSYRSFSRRKRELVFRFVGHRGRYSRRVERSDMKPRDEARRMNGTDPGGQSEKNKTRKKNDAKERGR